MSKRAIYIIICAMLMIGFLCAPGKAHAASIDSIPGMVSTNSGRLNVRASASTSAATVSSLGKGSYVTLISKSGSWWYVEYAKGKYGYCHSDYISALSGSAATVNTQSSSLNVRSGAGTTYSKVASLAKGETVIVLSSTNGWSRILYHGTKTGYVSAQYLSGYYSAVSLSVPNYKQTDSRWAGTLIGESGKTMAQIGCATTAVAMMESYRTGTNVYPHIMAQNLRYTSDGSLYWPTHYTTVTDGTGYLSRIYNQLKAGKPVLFGARNAYGKQHWVVITGFTGGSALTASGFTVNDPGSSSRTNLQTFLREYPTFYKYFYY